jgi:hypothetical protein
MATVITVFLSLFAILAMLSAIGLLEDSRSRPDDRLDHG